MPPPADRPLGMFSVLFLEKIMLSNDIVPLFFILYEVFVQELIPFVPIFSKLTV